MSFAGFLATINSAGLRAVAQHWNEARGAARLPAWSDLRPSAIAPQLPNVWAWRYDWAERSFTGRLAGDNIESLFGRSIRNAAMKDIFAAEHYEAILARHRRVVETPEFFHGTGSVFRHFQRYGGGERIILPLTDGIVGATLYVKLDAAALSKPQEREHEEWFALE